MAAILIEALRVEATGELELEARGGVSRVYFNGGTPCGAQPSFDFKPLGQFLLEEGWIDMRALERSLVAVADGRKQGEALVSLGFLTEDQLGTALALHHASHLRMLAALDEGQYRFTPTDRLPAWSHSIRIPACRGVIDALALPAGKSVCTRILRSIPESSLLRLTRGWQDYAGHFQLDEGEGMFLSKLAEARSLPEILGVPGLEPSRVWALTASLYVTGVLVPMQGGAAKELQLSSLPSPWGGCFGDGSFEGIVPLREPPQPHRNR